MISIDGLTPKQVSLLDAMWAINSEEELDQWRATLPAEDARMSRTLQTMVEMAMLDEYLDENPQFEDARKLIAAVQCR